MEQDMVWGGGGLKKENIAQGNMAHRLAGSQSEHLRRIPALRQQTRMYLP